MNLIFRDRRFAPLFWTQFAGALNDNFFKNALVMLVTYESVHLFGLDSLSLVPFAGGVFILPFFLFSATAGQMADHFEKSSLIRIVKVAEIIIMAMAGIGLYFQSYGILFFVLFLMGAQSSFFGPLKYSIIPSLVSPGRLVAGNACVSGGTFIAILLGTLLGGVFVQGEHSLFFLCGGPFLIALGGFFFSRKIQRLPLSLSSDPVDKKKIDYTFIRPTFHILKLTMKDRKILGTVFGVSWYWFIGAAVLSMLPPLVKELLYGKAEVATFFLALFTVGMGVGSYLTQKISRTKIEIGLVPLSTLGMSLCLLLMGAAIAWGGSSPTQEILESSRPLLGMKAFYGNPEHWRFSLFLFMMALFGGGHIVPLMAHMQVLSKPSELSQTIAGNNIWNALFMVGASLFVMFFSKVVGLGGTFLLLGLINVVVSFLLYWQHSEETLRFWMRILSQLFYRVKVVGGEDFPKEGPVILISNHMSFVDWLILMGAIDRPIHWVIDHSYYYRSIIGLFLFRQAGLIPIASKREKPQILKKAFEMIPRDLERGGVLGLFPEGQITRDGHLGDFRPGILKILKETPVPVVMASLDGLWGSLLSYKRGKILFKFPESLRRKIVVEFSAPIAPEDFDLNSSREWISSRVSDYRKIRKT